MRSKYEIKAQHELEAEGWIVDYKIRPSRFFKGQHIDFFSLFDLVAIRPQDEHIRWISIKGHGGIPKAHHEAIRAFRMPSQCSKEIWCWPGNKKKSWIKKILV